MNFNYYNNKKFVLVGDQAEINKLRKYFSEPNIAARFGKNPNIPQKLYAISPNNRCDIGLLFLISKTYKQFYRKKAIIDSRVVSLAMPSIKTNKDIVNYSLKYPLRDYQQEAVDRCIKMGRGVINLATAGGKTLILSSLLQYYYKNVDKNFKCVVIVPDLGLVNQTFGDFTEYNCSFTYSMWTGKIVPDFNVNCIITNIGILQSKNTDTSVLKSYNLVIVDECHKVRNGNKINKILTNIKTPNKFGLTGTLPTQKIDVWNITGKLGPVIYEKKAHELRDSNYVVPAEVTIIGFNYSKSNIYSGSTMGHYKQEMDFIVKNKARNNLIVDLNRGFKNNTLVLVDFIEHGKKVYEACCTLKDKQVHFIQGNVAVEERKIIQDLLESKDDNIVIAISKIFSTGINIKNLHNIILANGGKSKIKILQTIGRGLRLHKSKAVLQLYDIKDMLKYGKKHAKQRQNFYKKELMPFKQILTKETEYGS
jgi:superfamily II DNA or RNA helicase